MSDDAARSPFKDYVPQPWDYQGSTYHVVKQKKEFSGQYHLHNLNDQINDGRGDLEKCLIAYQINGETHDLFTVKDYFNSNYSFDMSQGLVAGNVSGDMRERIARRNMKYFLRNFSGHGHIGDLLSEVSEGERDGFLIANNDTYVLKILNYPNMVLLKKDKEGKLGYENIKELDGLFDYQYFMKQHLIILESKSDSFAIDTDKLKDNLFEPMKELFPGAQLHYVLFANERRLFTKAKRNITVLHKHVVPLHETLMEYGVQPFYFSFRETRDDLARMTDHLFMQHDLINKQGVEFIGRVMHTQNDLVVFDAGQTPHIRLRRNEHTGFWKEITKFRHRNGKKKNNNNKK